MMGHRPATFAPGLPPVAMLSFDLEDWHQHTSRRMGTTLPPVSPRVLRQAELVLKLLQRHRANATFFVLGNVAERYPELVRSIHEAGHEVASHGSAHIPLHRLGRDEVREDLSRSIGLIRDVIDEPVLGFRAPEFSITGRNFDVLGELIRQGLRYDSSIFPIRHRRYGIPNFPRTPTWVNVPGGQHDILELPLSTWRMAGVNLPVAGGGYFRFLPQAFLVPTLERLATRRELPALYFHPYEFDDGRLHVPVPPGWGKMRKHAWQALQNVGRSHQLGKVGSVLESVRVVRCRDVLGWAEQSRGQQIPA